jgi:3-oxoadipate enol-lactonase
MLAGLLHKMFIGKDSEMLPLQSTKTGFAEIPGARLYYEIAGDGDPVVFIHGGFLDRRMWDEQFAFFAQRYQAIRYDMRCAGKTETFPSTESYTHYQDLYNLLHELQLRRVTLIGLSLGARTALDFAIEYPELVQKLVVVSPNISGYEFRDEWINEHGAKMLKALAAKDLVGAVEELLILWTDGPDRTSSQVDPDVRERIREMVTHAFPLSRLAPNVGHLEPPALGRLAEMHMPTLIVMGDKDIPEVHLNGKRLHEQVVGAELAMISDVAHTLIMEKPEEFNTLVDHFLCR